ncbi:MAG: hypothetical protein AAFS01_00460 [Pseudomonadota bacterium]
MLVFLSSSMVAANEYLINISLGRYEKALISLNSNQPEISGEIMPLAFVDGSTFAIGGTRISENKIALKFPFETRKGREVVFTRNVSQDRTTWTSGGSNPIKFFRPIHGTLSDVAKALYKVNCGPYYGAFDGHSDIVYTPLEFASFIPSVSASDVSTNERGWFRVDVSVGTELYVIEKIRKIPGVTYANLLDGGCGFGEASFFTTSKTAISSSGELDAAKFSQFLRSKTEEFLSRNKEYSEFQRIVQQQAVSRAAAPPFPLFNRITVIAPSGVTRENGNTWDRFDISFNTADLPGLSDQEIGIIVWVERLHTGTGAAKPNRNPPRVEYIGNQLDYVDEGIVATLFSHFASSQSNGYCVTEVDTPDPKIYELCRENVDKL